jgi:hypothetical protein
LPAIAHAADHERGDQDERDYECRPEEAGAVALPEPVDAGAAHGDRDEEQQPARVADRVAGVSPSAAEIAQSTIAATIQPSWTS